MKVRNRDRNKETGKNKKEEEEKKERINTGKRY
jgi:hypothetical protein